MRSFGEAMSDPVEGPLVRPFLDGTATDDDRRAYQAWLASIGDPRGELLALATALASATEPAPAALIDRFRALRAEIDERWWRLIRSHAWILNCGSQRDEPAAIRFAFECPRTWEELEPTRDPAIRQCDQCEEAVFVCATIGEAEDHARRGRCIAVPGAVAGAVHQRELAHRMITGRPHAPSYWGRRIFGE